MVVQHFYLHGPMNMKGPLTYGQPKLLGKHNFELKNERIGAFITKMPMQPLMSLLI